ncbi:MAG: DEAD/DEAH box helicase [Planctomycetes bacterium]|nr:DEAD/DEAH box helicase [Planctomycetota bacterium]MCH9723282.1 DEAD/DEAH box helicase [Planctomycetota bacterium]MCH9777971.1 DEAD/DEAH box helicase [Planctomycetota bacterium]MCH9789898.1 DEAD/DEAH box helicase [Planctomycetota bacterium]
MTKEKKKKKTKKQKAKSSFSELGLNDEILKNLGEAGYEIPSPIQAELIPIAVKGQDCIGQARTGTGKTAAFSLPVLQQIDLRRPGAQALILAPTRELSEQVAEEIRKLCPDKSLNLSVLVGGKPLRPQENQLKRGAQIAVGTPGRVIDHINRGNLKLNTLEFVVLDEADRMLDIGFRPDIEKILRKCPEKRQTLLLSATMPPPVERLARRYMQEPVVINLSEDKVSVDAIDQYYITVDPNRKVKLLSRLLFQERPKQTLVFTRTKRGADKLDRIFSKKLKAVAAIHGDLPQSKRDRVLKEFREGKIRLLIATDVMGRGIDVSGISHIINYDIPEFSDDYVHRIGRVGRLSSDQKGAAFTFVAPDEGDQLTNIENRINHMISEFRVDDFEAYKPQKPRKKIETVSHLGNTEHLINPDFGDF